MSRRALLVAQVLLALTFALAMPVGTARANGVPTLVRLTYLDGLSNWGPREASGTLELALGEGYAKVDAAGLPRLAGEQYQGWLVNSQSNDAISIGTFNAAAGGGISYRGTLPTTPNFGFDLFIITVEPSPDDIPTPSDRRAIGGRFSLIGQRNPDGSFAAPNTFGAGGGPRQLPNTGDNTLTSDLVRVGALVAGLGIAAATVTMLGRRHA